MRKIYFLFFLISLFTFGQTNVSTLEDKRAVIEKFISSKMDSAKVLSNVLLILARKSKSNTEIANAQSTISLIKIKETNFEEAKKWNDSSFIINNKLKNSNELGKNYFNYALISSSKSDFVNSIRNYLIGLKFAEMAKNLDLQKKIYRGLANSNLDQRNYENALIYIKKGLNIGDKSYENSEKGLQLATLAEIYRLKQDAVNANKYFKIAYDLFIKLNDISGQAYVLTNWSLCFEDNPFKLLEMELKAQKIWDKIEPENTMSITNLGNIAYTYFDVAKTDSLLAKYKNKKQALQLSNSYYERCLKIATKKKNLDSSMYFSQQLAELQYYNNDFKKAYNNLKLRNLINDSLYSQRNKNTIAKLESQKEIDKKNQLLKINKLAIEAQQKQKWFYILGIGSLAILGGLLFYQSRNRKKNNEKLQILNSELDQANKIKTRFFSILNHDLRSPVSNLIHFLHLQQNNPELLDEETKNRMQTKTITGAENLLSSMEDILLWSKGQMENFKPQPKNIAINQLFDDTRKVFSGYLNIKFDYQNPNNLEIFTDENYLKTIVRNLTSNAINVFTTTENPTIIWKAWKENGKSYLSITDNGSGASKDNFKALYDDTEVVGIKTGLGLHLIRDLAKAIDCEILVDSKIGEGTTFILRL
jgi:signal transduction histidine kinase